MPDHRRTFFFLILALVVWAAPVGAQDNESVSLPAMPSSMADQGGGTFDAGTGTWVQPPQEAVVNGQKADIYPAPAMNSGMLLPDGNGGYIWVGSENTILAAPDFKHDAAREIKLLVRELADQLLATMPNETLRGAIAVPVSFVSQDNFEATSSLGRYIAEQMYFEFNQRGFPIREYRLAPMLTTQRGQGEFLLSRDTAGMPSTLQSTVFLVGTYYHDRDNVFVNARLIDGATGLVLRSGNVVFPQTNVTRKMLDNERMDLEVATTSIRDFRAQSQQRGAQSDIDQGYDIR